MLILRCLERWSTLHVYCWSSVYVCVDSWIVLSPVRMRWRMTQIHLSRRKSTFSRHGRVLWMQNISNFWFIFGSWYSRDVGIARQFGISDTTIDRPSCTAALQKSSSELWWLSGGKSSRLFYAVLCCVWLMVVHNGTHAHKVEGWHSLGPVFVCLFFSVLALTVLFLYSVVLLC